MTKNEQEELKATVKKAVRDVVPKTLNDMLSPLIEHQVKRANKHLRWMFALGYFLGAVAIGLLFMSVQDRADENTNANERQDCVLAGLIRGVSPTVPAGTQTKAALNAALAQLEFGKKCPRNEEVRNP